MADAPPSPHQKVTLQSLLAQAAVPFLSRLCCNPEGTVTAQGVRTVIFLAQTGIFGTPSEATSVLKLLWEALSPPNSLPCMSSDNSLKELRKACKAAGVYTGGRKGDLLARLPPNLPPAFLRIINEAKEAEREQQAEEVIAQFNAEGKIQSYPRR